MDAANIKRIWSISDRLALLRPGVAAEALRSSRRSNHAIAKQSREHGSDINRKRIQNILIKQDVVEQAMVLFTHGPGEAGDDAFEAFITTHKVYEEEGLPGDHGVPSSSTNDEHKEQRVEFWADYWNTIVYSAMDNLDLGSIGRDFLGWTSLYDGKEIDKNEMNEWLDETITTIVDLCAGGASHVLEIGTGSGMILFNVISEVQSYVGLEMSPTAVSFIKEVLKSKGSLTDKVHMLQGTAADLSSLQMPTEPDLVIINSVAQYFPTQQYLLGVIEAIGKIPSVNKAFFGDVRSLALYDEFLFSKGIHDLGDKATSRELRSAMSTAAQREMELLIDPSFFTALPDRLAGLVKHVEILPKCMKANNELSRFRYGVVIHFNRQSDSRLVVRDVDMANSECLDFFAEGLDMEALYRRLQASSSDTLLVSNIPNVKTSVDSRLFDIATGREVSDDGDYDIQSSGWIPAARRVAERRPAMSTLDLLEVAHRSGNYKVAMSAARQFSQRGGIDAIFYKAHDIMKNSGEHAGGLTRFRFPTDHAGRDMDTLTTHPMRLQAKRTIVERLKQSLQAELPVHLVPRQIHVVEEMPKLGIDQDHSYAFQMRLF
jgi:SAM-dependent methyltransferase